VIVQHCGKHGITDVHGELQEVKARKKEEN
jgi:hypothetical protein